MTENPDNPTPLPSNIVRDPVTGDPVVWSSGDPFLDGMYMAAEVALGWLFPFYVSGSGDGLFINSPAPSPYGA